MQIILLPSNEEMYTEMAFKLYTKYQLIIHNDKPERLTPKNLQRFCYQSPLKVITVQENERSEKSDLYRIDEKNKNRTKYFDCFSANRCWSAK